MSNTTTVTATSTTVKTPKYLSRSCQQVAEEDFSTLSARVVIHSRLDEDKLWPTISQHICNETALVSSGRYADMAAVVGEYIWKAYRGRDAELPGVNVSHMEVTKTFIAMEPPPADGNGWRWRPLLQSRIIALETFSTPLLDVFSARSSPAAAELKT